MEPPSFAWKSSMASYNTKRMARSSTTSGKVPTYPLLLDSWIGTVTAAINNAVISGLVN